MEFKHDKLPVRKSLDITSPPSLLRDYFAAEVLAIFERTVFRYSRINLGEIFCGGTHVSSELGNPFQRILYFRLLPVPL